MSIWKRPATVEALNATNPGTLNKLRYDELHRQLESAPDTRVFRTLTPALEVAVTPKMRLMLDYERRWILAPDGSADAKRIVDTAGDRVMLQASMFVP